MKYTAQVTSELDAWHCGEQVSDWLTAHFSPYTPDKRYYLVYAPANHYGETLLYNGRALQQYLKWQESENKRALFEGRKEKALFQDLTRFSLATMPSLHQHRTVTGRKTDSMLRFRPNFVVDGKFNPFDEDKWYKIKIGNVIFERVKGISRCVMVNIDESGNVDRGSNTCLNSLMRYRKVTAVLDDLESQHNMNSAIFGAHLVYSGVEINGVEHNVWIPDLKFGIRPRRTRKHGMHNEEWQRSQQKRKRSSGLQYTNWKGAVVPAKRPLPCDVVPCESHYVRKQTTRKFLEAGLNTTKMYEHYKEKCSLANESDPLSIQSFRHIFNTEFNLSFHRPKKTNVPPVKNTSIWTKRQRNRQRNRLISTSEGKKRLVRRKRLIKSEQ